MECQQLHSRKRLKSFFCPQTWSCLSFGAAEPAARFRGRACCQTSCGVSACRTWRSSTPTTTWFCTPPRSAWDESTRTTWGPGSARCPGPRALRHARVRLLSPNESLLVSPGLGCWLWFSWFRRDSEGLVALQSCDLNDCMIKGNCKRSECASMWPSEEPFVSGCTAERLCGTVRLRNWRSQFAIQTP